MKLKLFGLLLLVLTVSFASAWMNTSFTQRMLLNYSVPWLPANVTSVPLYFNVSYNGMGALFSNEFDTNPLYSDFEGQGPSGEGDFWFLPPILPTNTNLTSYFYNNSPTTYSNVTNVTGLWNNTFARWDCNNQTHPIGTDSTGNHNLSGSTVLANTSNELFGSSCAINGQNFSADISSLGGSGGVTFAYWLRVNSTFGSNAQFEYDTEGDATFLRLQTNFADLTWGGFASSVTSGGTSLVTPGKWHFIVATYNPSNGKGEAWVDGNKILSGSVGAGTITLGKRLYWGTDAMQQSSSLVFGEQDEMRIYNFTQPDNWIMAMSNLTNNLILLRGATTNNLVTTPPPNVTLIYPPDLFYDYVAYEVFNFTPNSTDGSFGNATLYSNFSGTWKANATNSSILVNGSVNNMINVSGLAVGGYIWNVLVCDTHGCSFAQNNQTVSNYPVNSLICTLNAPVNNTSSSSNGFTFNYTPIDYIFFPNPNAHGNITNASVWVANVSKLGVGIPGVYWGQNQTPNSSVIINNTVNSIISNGFSEGLYVWNVNVSDIDCPNTPCQQPLPESNMSFVNFTFIIDRTNPLAAILVSPLNNSVGSSNTITFSFIPNDALSGSANTTLYVYNSSGSIINTTFNGTAVNGTAINVNVILGLGSYNFTVMTCDNAGNCANGSISNNFTIIPFVPSNFSQCNNGDFIVGQNGIVNAYAFNVQQPLPGLTCQAFVFFDNNTNHSMALGGVQSMTDNGGGWYNLSFNPTFVGSYLAAVNCSNSTNNFTQSYVFKAVSLCTGVTLISSGNDMSFPVIDLTLIEFIWALVVIFFVAGSYFNSKIVLFFAAALSMVAGALFFSTSLGSGINVLSNVGQNLTFNYASGNLATANATLAPSYVSMQNTTNSGLGLASFTFGLALLALLIFAWWKERATGKKTELEE